MDIGLLTNGNDTYFDNVGADSTGWLGAVELPSDEADPYVRAGIQPVVRSLLTTVR